MAHIISRRQLVGAAGLLAAATPARLLAVPRRRQALARVIVDNDFGGDPDGLFQLAHHVLCHSLTIPLIIASHLPPRFEGPRSATKGAAKAAELLKLMGRDEPRPLAGSEGPIATRAGWRAVAATSSIVQEAMRADTSEALIYAAGAGLTDLALAWLAEPRIGQRLRLVWIGGPDHDAASPTAGVAEMEFNLSLDPVAARIIFNESDIEIWQVPASSYRRMLFSNTELDELAGQSRVGAFLKNEVEQVAVKLAAIPGVPPLVDTEAYVLGDSPLVTLTALLPPIHPDPSSSDYRLIPTPHLNGDGTYRPNPKGRPMRVYSNVDANLTFRDMLAKFRTLSGR